VRPHDFRRTAASMMASAGIPRLIVAKVLNHVDRGVSAIYDRHSYDAEKRVALETWERTLTAILEKKPAGAVVPFSTGASR
jgi:integrase